MGKAYGNSARSRSGGAGCAVLLVLVLIAGSCDGDSGEIVSGRPFKVWICASGVGFFQAVLRSQGNVVPFAGTLPSFRQVDSRGRSSVTYTTATTLCAWTDEISCAVQPVGAQCGAEVVVAFP